MRQTQYAQFAQETGAAQPLGRRRLDQLPRFARVAVTGRLDTHRQLLLDNRVQDGKAGYDVLLPLALADGRLLLIDRGWIPFGVTRAQLPDVSLDVPPDVTLIGRIDHLPAAGLSLGRAPPAPGDAWPKVTSFPGSADLDAAYGRHVEPFLLLLDPGQPFGFERHWTPPGLPPERHWGYAFQWWSFAVLAVILWFYTALK